MEISKAISRIKKNPKTLPIKIVRFLKRLIKDRPLTLERYQKLNLKINKNTLLLTPQEFIIKDADKILNKEYEIFNKTYKINDINWHKDYEHDYTWPLKNFELDKEGTDKKFPWELNRFQHLTTLALAYKQTNDQKYSQEILSQINDWIKNNPYGQGINWYTPMECSIRAINLIQIYLLLETEELLPLIYNHGKYIRNNLEWSPAKENHYLTDLMGLFFIGLFFNNKWTAFAKKELEKEILLQVSEDGVDYEASLNYHRLVTEIFLLTLLVAKKNNIEFSESFKKRTENMCNFIMYYTPNSGNAPQIGDTDNSRILDVWNKNINDHRDILSLASLLFNQPEFKGKFHKRLTLLINKKELQSKEIILYSKSFKDYYIIRDEDLFLLIHCGNIGRNNFGGHGHNDQLSFVLSYENEDYIIDAGTYNYTFDKELRNSFRSTNSHNTLQINDEEQNIISKETPFNMEHKSNAKCILFKDNIFEGEHSGFTTKVKRKITYNKENKEVIIEDFSEKNVDLQLNLHLHPSVKVTKKENKYTLNYKTKIFTEESDLIPTKYSSGYDQIEDSNMISIKKYGNYIKTIIQF